MFSLLLIVGGISILIEGKQTEHYILKKYI